MRSNLRPALDFVLHGYGAWAGEGGYVGPSRGDKNYTNRGITLTTLSGYLGRKATVDELKALSETKAGAIYLSLYWAPIRADLLPPGVDLILFDIAVNSGVGKAKQFAAETNSISDAVARVKAIDAKRVGWWRRLWNWGANKAGWMSREKACLARALELARAPVAATIS